MMRFIVWCTRCMLASFVLLVHTSFVSPPPGKDYLADPDFKFKFEEALDYFNYDEFDIALPLFKQLLRHDPSNSNLNFFLGVSYMNSSYPIQEAIPYLEIAAKHVEASYSNSFKETNAPIFALFHLAEAYHLNYEFDKAKRTFVKFRKYLTDKNRDQYFLDETVKRINRAENAMTMVQDSIENIRITPLNRNVNTEYNEYSPSISADGTEIYFGSQRKGNLGGNRLISGGYYDDIYSSGLKENGWYKSKRVRGRGINTSEVDVFSSISKDGKMLFFYRFEKKNFDIYYTVSTEKRGKVRWGTPEKLSPSINTKENETNACISEDGFTIFFVSDRQGGIGGKDIYMSENIGTNEWSRPYNLGHVINTEFDEDFPIIHKDGVTLYFSSKGHYNMGGFDIFISTMSEDGQWDKPENIGYPINTPYDDSSITFISDESRAYYCSAKNRNSAVSDIFEIRFDYN